VTDVTPEPADGGTHGFLFADLRGYTKLVDSRGATEASHLLERYRLLTRDVVSKHGGAEIKTEGDRLLRRPALGERGSTVWSGASVGMCGPA